MGGVVPRRSLVASRPSRVCRIAAKQTRPKARKLAPGEKGWRPMRRLVLVVLIVGLVCLSPVAVLGSDCKHCYREQQPNRCDDAYGGPGSMYCYDFYYGCTDGGPQCGFTFCDPTFFC